MRTIFKQALMQQEDYALGKLFIGELNVELMPCGAYDFVIFCMASVCIVELMYRGYFPQGILTMRIFFFGVISFGDIFHGDIFHGDIFHGDILLQGYFPLGLFPSRISSFGVISFWDIFLWGYFPWGYSPLGYFPQEIFSFGDISLWCSFLSGYSHGAIFLWGYNTRFVLNLINGSDDEKSSTPLYHGSSIMGQLCTPCASVD